MSQPHLDIQVEPIESGKAEYLPLAATTATGKTGLKIVLRLRLQNNGTSMVKVKGIRFSFPGSSYAPVDMQGVNRDGSLDLGVGAVAYWSNGRVDLNPDPNVDDFINNSVYLTGGAPGHVTVDIECKDFTDPATISLSLKPHKSPVAGNA